MIYLIDLEPIEKRYTKQWRQWFVDYCIQNNIEYTLVSGKTRKFKKGEFLDINRTNMYKADQVNIIANLFDKNKIKDNDIFFFFDGWHFGVTATKYMADLQDIKIKIISYWHAGSYDPWDFISLKNTSNWAQHIENSWFEINDKILVATEFHKKLILDNRICSKNKIKVVGFPFDTDYLINQEKIKKENIIVFPHRIAKEKQPNLFDKISKLLPDYKFIKTIEVTKTKQEYYNILKKSKIVWSGNLQETFGIGTLEGVMFNCLPLVPNRLCYSELYQRDFLYNDENEMILKIKDFIENYELYVNSEIFKHNKFYLTNIKTNIENIFKELIF